MKVQKAFRIPCKSFFLLLLVNWSIFPVPNLFAVEDAWVVPRTEFGTPDLQGNWNKLFRAPLQRPVELGEKRAYGEQEAREIMDEFAEAERIRHSPIEGERVAPPVGDSIAQQSDLNFRPQASNLALVNGEYRTSIIVEPANGRLPYLEEFEDIYGRRLRMGQGAFDGPEARPASERCLNQGAQIPYMVDVAARFIQIVQTHDYTMILNEKGPQVRIIRMNSEHPVNGFPKWGGDSIGHWEGDSLVVHTIGFRPEQSNGRIRSSTMLEVTETFTRVSNQDLIYRYTVVDPEIYSEPWVAELPFRRMAEGENLYEAACHEGNYSLPGILAGARRLEADAREVKDTQYLDN